MGRNLLKARCVLFYHRNNLQVFFQFISLFSVLSDLSQISHIQDSIFFLSLQLTVIKMGIFPDMLKYKIVKYDFKKTRRSL